MEALTLSPVKASHQTAEPQGTPQGPSGLGDIFAVLFEQATIRLDARPADLASFETRRTDSEPPRQASATEAVSSAASQDWREDADFRADAVESDTREARDPVEPRAPAEEAAAVAEDDGFAAPAPDRSEQPETAAADDEAHDPARSDIQLAEGQDAEAPAPAALDDTDPAPEVIAAPAALPLQVQPAVASAAALTVAQALGAGEAAFAALARTAAQSRAPATAASNIIPAAASPVGVKFGAARVLVTPAAVVAQPNAALGGGATVAALAAIAGQAAAQNGVQNGVQNTPASVPNAASQIQTQPGAGSGPSGLVAGGQAPAGDTPISTQGATHGQNGNGAANAAQIAVAAPATGLPGQGPGTPTSPAGDQPGNPNPQNAQTAFAGSNNQNAGNSGTPGGPGAVTPASEAGVSNRLAQNARSDSAQTPAAPMPGAGDPNGTDSGQLAGASRTQAGANQGVRPAALDSNQNNAPQTARGDGSAPAGFAAQAAAQNVASGTVTPASAPRADSASQTNGNGPTIAGTPGLTLTAAGTPQILPAPARPAVAASLPASQVAVHIQRAAAAGQDRIRITLHPAELGQIDIKLSVSNDGAVRAIVSIERPETFELLQRDARGLEKALQDAGLKTDSGSLSFNLKGENERDTAADREGADSGSQEAGNDTQAEPELAPEIIAAANAGGAEHILDLHV